MFIAILKLTLFQSGLCFVKHENIFSKGYEFVCDLLFSFKKGKGLEPKIWIGLDI